MNWSICIPSAPSALASFEYIKNRPTQISGDRVTEIRYVGLGGHATPSCKLYTQPPFTNSGSVVRETYSAQLLGRAGTVLD